MPLVSLPRNLTLSYMSESDAPLRYFEIGREAACQWPPPTVTQFLEMIGVRPLRIWWTPVGKFEMSGKIASRQ